LRARFFDRSARCHILRYYSTTGFNLKDTVDPIAGRWRWISRFCCGPSRPFSWSWAPN